MLKHSNVDQELCEQSGKFDIIEQFGFANMKARFFPRDGAVLRSIVVLGT